MTNFSTETGKAQDESENLFLPESKEMLKNDGDILEVNRS